jgi:hypothetical protein
MLQWRLLFLQYPMISLLGRWRAKALTKTFHPTSLPPLDVARVAGYPQVRWEEEEGEEMTGKEFLNSLVKGKTDILQQLLGILTETDSSYCLIGGLAVSAYVEPVVSLDVTIVVAIANILSVANTARSQKLKVEEFPHSLNLSGSDSDFRIQEQTDPRYQSFITNVTMKEILGYEMKVASVGQCITGQAVDLHG